MAFKKNFLPCSLDDLATALEVKLSDKNYTRTRLRCSVVVRKPKG